MSSENKTENVLIEAALNKVKRIQAGNAFTTDFEAGRIIQDLVIELKAAQKKLEKQRKLVKLYKLYIKKIDNKGQTMLVETAENFGCLLGIIFDNLNYICM